MSGSQEKSASSAPGSMALAARSRGTQGTSCVRCTRLIATAAAALVLAACSSSEHELCPGVAASAAAPGIPIYPAPELVTEGPERLPPIRVWVAPQVTERAAVLEGIAGWQYSMRGVRDWVVVEADPIAVVDTDVADSAIRVSGTVSPSCGDSGVVGALGCVNGVGGLWQNESGQAMDVWLFKGVYERLAKLTVMHELGHQLGLTHGGGIMDEQASGDWDCPDAETIDRLAEKFSIYGMVSCSKR